MPYQSYTKLISLALCFALITLSGCRENAACAKYIGETYLNEPIDTALEKGATVYRDTLLKRFGETPIKGLNYTAYHLQYYTSHGFGQSIKFEKNDFGYFLSVKCYSEKEGLNPYCSEYQTNIKEDEWNQFEEMIYQFNFWTAPQFKTNKNVLDGFGFTLEGIRPEAKNCDKRAYQFVGRGSPRYDKMGALCNYIMEYEDHLAQRYQKREIK